MDAVENTLFNIGIVPFQTPQQRLDLLPLGPAATVIADRTVFREAAGTLDKFQLIVALPGKNIVFMNAVQGSDQFHSLEVCTVQLWHHRLYL